MLIDRLNKNVRFKAQTYTDRGPTNKFKNEYNSRFELKIENISVTPIKLFPMLANLHKQLYLVN